MIQEDWKRIAGIHFEDEGNAAAVWFAHDRHTDIIHVYDACLFSREILIVIAESLNARGMWIPIAWERKQKPLADKLKDRGCDMIHEPFEDSDAVAEAISRDMEERMRTQRFRVEKRLVNWLDELKAFTRKDQKVPRAGFPLMSATRYAMGAFDEWARPERLAGGGKPMYPEIHIV